MEFVNGLKDVDVVSVEHVELPLEPFDISGKLFEALNHKLGTVVTEILVFLGVDLRVVEDENGGHLLVFLKLADERGIVY